MSHLLNPISFPLHGSRLIEASAGTGKTWTIAALYLRLVLGHGDENAFQRALHPSEILVMTFTRAATRELSDRIRQRLTEAANYFRSGDVPAHDHFIRELMSAYPTHELQQQAAYRLSMAAQAMDEAAIFTIDAWCQRMLKEHAFDSGCLFDEELIASESSLLENAALDYWRQQVYPLDSNSFSLLTSFWSDAHALSAAVLKLVPFAGLLGPRMTRPLSALIEQTLADQEKILAALKAGWADKAEQMAQWFAEQKETAPKQFSATKLKPANLEKWLTALKVWAQTPSLVWPDGFDKAAEKLTPDGLRSACNKGYEPQIPEIFNDIAPLAEKLGEIEPIKHVLYRHAVSVIVARADALKRNSRQFGFNDMLQRLRAAVSGPNAAALNLRIRQQYPVALVDEFQDTSPDQYAIFDAIYRIEENAQTQGLFLIGDPKQSIYGFRGADIQSYLAAREATTGRHYMLGTNFRSTHALVGALNHLFLHAEKNEDAAFAAGAFRFRRAATDPVPFEAVTAHGRAEKFVNAEGEVSALNLWASANPDMKKDEYLSFFAENCAEHIVTQLNSAQTGFQYTGDVQRFQRLQAADIAILVRDKFEAEAIRSALQKRHVASVYLSDKDSVLNSDEASDVLRWLHAFANPLDDIAGRAAFATKTAKLSIAQLITLASDDEAWENCTTQLKELHLIWQRQGVLAAIRRFIHMLELPAKLLSEVGGERSLTNILHLAELLETASMQLDGEQSLVRWLAEQMADDSQLSDEHILRLESDAKLVKVITIHKSKGLQYPLVYLPFAVSNRVTTRMNRSFFDYVDESGVRKIDFALSQEALDAVDRVRKEEDIRLFYVAVTRAVHTLWLGVSSNQNKIHESAFGYLLAGETTLAAAALIDALQKMRNDCNDITITDVAELADVNIYEQQETKQSLVEMPEYKHEFERDWTVGSFTSLTRSIATTGNMTRVQDSKLLEDDGSAPVTVAGHSAWHRFPRGAMPGQFLHEQLEWMAGEGFESAGADTFDARLAARCQRAGWDNHFDDILLWLKRIVATPLLPANVRLQELSTFLPEMEFWFPCERVNAQQIDRLCQEFFLDGTPRDALAERDLHGLLMGFADLVFEYQGKYWVLDYKSNVVAADDAGYHRAALASAMAAHRYDVQGAIYMLALHRLLQLRLGETYNPAIHLGGAIFFFMRGVANEETHGCYQLEANPEFLGRLDQMMRHDEASAAGNSVNDTKDIPS
ncbi:exodeoxyribonuclease V subunit beta [Undibacterium sp. WLHG33]|uniref:exodeoxyribonuclease V subunit beta n=1 Tax=Undibacterium sp. WLHG33 TaxID=3412482 RepID=UPI003C30665E